MVSAVDGGSPVELEDGAPEKGGGTEPADSARALRHALEAALLWFLGVGYNVAAINYVFSPSPALGAALRVAGTLHVDSTVLFFLLQGLDAAAEPPTERWAHVRTAFPDLCLSAAAHLVLQAATCLGCAWDWANTALSPLFLSPFVDVRRSNVFRGVNEVAWIVQTHALLLAAFPEIAAHVREHAGRALNMLLFIWGSSFGQIYVAVAHPEHVNIMTRNILTNVVFFAFGVAVWEARPGGATREILGAPLARVPVWQVGAAVLAVLVFYLQHAVAWPESAECVSLFGGAPCLWDFDAANARLLPLVVLGLLWYADDGGLFPPNLCGELAEPLAVPFAHVAALVGRGRPYGRAWLLFGSILGLALHATLFAIAPGACAAGAHLLIPAEAAAVTALTAPVYRAVQAHVHPLAARACALLPGA